MAVHEVQFANFVCKFGDAPMRHFLKEIILPAFTDDTLTRSYGEDTYFHLYDVQLGTVGPSENPHSIIFGRFIKNTRVSRDQYFDSNKGLVKDHRELRSSPSAFFVLIVENHRLLYYSETPGAPELTSFAASLRKFIYEKHEKFVDLIYNEGRHPNEPGRHGPTKGAIRARIPRPHLEVVPLSDPTSIEEFIGRYRLLRRAEFRIIDTNDEVDAGALFQDIRDTFLHLNSTQTKLVSSNPKGLDLVGAAEITKEATQSGYQEVRFAGSDAEGNRLIGDNNNFALRSKIEEMPANDREKAEVLIERFEQLRAEGAIKVAEPDVPLSPDERDAFG